MSKWTKAKKLLAARALLIGRYAHERSAAREAGNTEKVAEHELLLAYLWWRDPLPAGPKRTAVMAQIAQELLTTTAEVGSVVGDPDREATS